MVNEELKRRLKNPPFVYAKFPIGCKVMYKYGGPCAIVSEQSENFVYVEGFDSNNNRFSKCYHSSDLISFDEKHEYYLRWLEAQNDTEKVDPEPEFEVKSLSEVQSLKYIPNNGTDFKIEVIVTADNPEVILCKIPVHSRFVNNGKLSKEIEKTRDDLKKVFPHNPVVVTWYYSDMAFV